MQIEISGSQHDRTDGKLIIAKPQGLDQFLELKKMSREQLKMLGCGIWEENEKCIHYLYPKEWYDAIPAGLEVVMITNRVVPFQPGITDDDTRYGMLAYGFLVAKDV